MVHLLRYLIRCFTDLTEFSADVFVVDIGKALRNSVEVEISCVEPVALAEDIRSAVGTESAVLAVNILLSRLCDADLIGKGAKDLVGFQSFDDPDLVLVG